jgi:hypothetical protein
MKYEMEDHLEPKTRRLVKYGVAGVVSVVLAILVIWGLSRAMIRSYDNWMEWVLRPVIRSEVNKTLCDYGLLWGDSVKNARRR